MNKESAIQYMIYRHHHWGKVIPNVHTERYGGSEVDALYLSSTNRAYFYEIKCSKSDFKADFKKKRHQMFLDRDDTMCIKPKYFYYVCHGFNISVEDIPEYAGLIIASEFKNRLEIVKKAPLLWNDPLSEKDLMFIHTKILHRYLNIRHKQGQESLYEMEQTDKKEI